MLFSKLFGVLRLDRVTSLSTFVNVSTLMSGTVLSTIIPVLFAPVMSRIFSPEHFGVVGLYVSVTLLVGVIAYSHYSHAIMLSVNNEEAKQVIWFTMLITTCISIITLIIVAILYIFTELINKSAVGLWCFFMPISIFLNGVNTTLMIWGNRTQQYKTLASNRVIQAAFTVALQISLGFMVPGETGLMVGLVAGQAIGAFLLVNDFCIKRTHNIGVPISHDFKAIAVRHKSFLFLSTPSDFINCLVNQAPFFLLQKFAGISAVGNYAFTQRLLGLPQLFISSAFTEVFKQKATSSFNTDGNCRNTFVKTFKSLSLIGVFPFLILIIFAPSLIAYIFGEEWKEAGVYAQFLGVLYFCRFVVSPLSYVYFIANKLQENFYLHILFLITTVVSFYIGHYFFSDSAMMILCYSVSYSLIYLIYLIRSYKFSLDGSV